MPADTSDGTMSRSPGLDVARNYDEREATDSDTTSTICIHVSIVLAGSPERLRDFSDN